MHTQADKGSADAALLSSRDAAAFLRLSESQIRKLRTSGRGPSYLKIGRAVRYSPDALRAWLLRHERRSTTDVTPAPDHAS